MKSSINISAYALCFLWVWLLAWCPTATAQGGDAQDLRILQEWRGDYPVCELSRFPETKRRLPIGYLDNRQQFTDVWQVFKPEEKIPEVDFAEHLVLFARNVVFFNRVGIAKVVLRDTVAEILIMETMSALPIEDKVGMALAVIPRAGVKYIKAGDEWIPVTQAEYGSTSDPLNTTYNVDGNDITLQNGHSEVAIRPDSATKIRTYISGDVVEGDLDGDGDKDAALLIAHDPGGSGTFYYVAVAEKRNGCYPGTNAVLLGDRITPKDLRIRNGLVIAQYATRGSHEPMSSAPSVETLLYMAFDNDKLKALKPLGTDEQILEGRVIIGHEIRSFYPCTKKTEYWLSGDSPALREVTARYQKTLPDAKPYTPLFMVLVGRIVEKPHAGYGADYAGAFLVTQLVGVRPEANCTVNNHP